MSATVRDRGAEGATPESAPAGPPAIRLSHLTKSFKLPHVRYGTLKERAMHGFRAPGFDILRAVDDVSVEVALGEFFGIVGRNGSGKSTMLKCLAGIYAAGSGSIEVNGRLAPFIELGVGFNPELTARDNVIINAIMLGLSRRDALARFDEIVAFAELEEFMDLRLKNYSSGMQVRLAFSVAIQVDAEILLIDEVLAVGDANFQQKCFDQFTRLKTEGRTIVFVTHDMGAVERFCDRAMLLDHGRLIEIGEPGAITRRYNELNFGVSGGAGEAPAGGEHEELVAELAAAWFESPTGEPIVATPQGEECCIRLDARFHQTVEDPVFGIAVRDELGRLLFATSTQLAGAGTDTFSAGELAQVRLTFQNWFAPGRYWLTASISRTGTGADLFDIRENHCSVIVHAGHSGGGAVDPPHRFEVTRA